jgi:5-(carboxyamino)imidazole ribonucleotide synthase
LKIGIIGGGQLALMMIQSQPNHEYYVLEPKIKNSVSKFATVINKPYNNKNALKSLMNICDVITYEFENIDSESLSMIESKLFPNSNLLSISQNRLLEKEYAKKCEVPVTIFYKVTKVSELEKILSSHTKSK